MGKTAFIFPGQGSQFVGMAKDLYDNSSVAKNMIKEAEDSLKIKLSAIMFGGPADELKQTDITQPAIFLHSAILLSLINVLKPEAAAGHSLGEYSALVSGKALDFISALKLVRLRGQSMLDAGIQNKGTMAAVIGLSDQAVESICSEASPKGIVQCANFNCPGQIVISGSVEGVYEAMRLAKSAGAKLVKELVVSGAFHSPLMILAKEKLQTKLEEIEIKNPIIPIYSNVTANPISKADDIKNLLLEQLTSPVKWQSSIENMIADGFNEFYEIGPGKVLQGLLKKINPEIKIGSIEKYEDLERFS